MNVYIVTSKLNFKNRGGSIFDLDLKARELVNLGNKVFVVTVFSNDNDFENPLPYKVIEENVKSRSLVGIQVGLFKIFKKYSKQADTFYFDGHFLYGAGLYRKFGGRVPVISFFNRELVCWPDNVSVFLKNKKENIFKKAKKKLRFLIEKSFGVFLANYIDFHTITCPPLKKAYSDFGLKFKEEPLIMGDLIDYKKTMQDNGIEKDSYCLRNKKDGIINLFYSGRMVPGKGFDIIVQAFSKIKNKENFKLILGGAGEEESQIKKMVDELGIKNYVEFPGWVRRDELFDFYKKADIFILPKWRKELTSVLLLEAMSFGLPCVVPGGGGLQWVAGNSALNFEDDNPSDLAKKIEILGGNYNLREKLSHNCFLRLAELDYKKIVSSLNQKIKELVKKN
ncbi:MAG: glycosyltransferase [Candidatus Marinimicrobia bacterium]|nr:glycosyltransferase [Candidatus Neomarinimicrobiota bacterium]